MSLQHFCVVSSQIFKVTIVKYKILFSYSTSWLCTKQVEWYLFVTFRASIECVLSKIIIKYRIILHERKSYLFFTSNQIKRMHMIIRAYFYDDCNLRSHKYVFQTKRTKKESNKTQSLIIMLFKQYLSAYELFKVEINLKTSC